MTATAYPINTNPRERAPLLTGFSFACALAIPLALLVLAAWNHLAPLPTGASTEAGFAAFLYGASRALVCWALATVVNFAGFMVGGAAMLVHREQRGRTLSAVAAGLNAAPHMLLLALAALGML